MAKVFIVLCLGSLCTETTNGRLRGEKHQGVPKQKVFGAGDISHTEHTETFFNAKAPSVLHLWLC